jgi:hypothetical protein
MRIVPAVVAGLALAAGAALHLMARYEQPYRHYATFAEAVAAGERDRGWLPAWMPSDATDLHIQGDLDTNAWWIRARLPASGVQSLHSHLVPVAVDSVRVRRPRRSGAWWMESLIEQHPANDNGLHADLFRGAGDPVPRTTVVAFDRASDAVYVWTSGIR